ncbi:MAG: hypothetical protein LBE10_09555 [Treponema sp.]|jgi:hypothetical protein|nr:hypothetical protein [Treponema sp.]
MRKEKDSFVLFFCLALICLVMSGCSQPSGSSDSGSTSTTDTPSTPTTGTLVVNNVSTYTDDAIVQIRIYEGNSADGTLKASSTTPVPKGQKQEFTGLTAGAYYVHVTDNREPPVKVGKVFGVTAGGTTNVNYTGTALN